MRGPPVQLRGPSFFMSKPKKRRWIISRSYLATYLNDHLAGSVMALDLLENLQSAHSATALADLCAGLHADITEDRNELEGLMKRLDISPSRTRQATAWFAEKM